MAKLIQHGVTPIVHCAVMVRGQAPRKCVLVMCWLGTMMLCRELLALLAAGAGASHASIEMFSFLVRAASANAESGLQQEASATPRLDDEGREASAEPRLDDGGREAAAEPRLEDGGREARVRQGPRQHRRVAGWKHTSAAKAKMQRTRLNSKVASTAKAVKELSKLVMTEGAKYISTKVFGLHQTSASKASLTESTTLVVGGPRVPGDHERQ